MEIPMEAILDRKRIEELGADDLRNLIEQGIAEGKCIDYKQELPEKQESKKKEFLHDVSSFANASGGYIVFGMKEDNGVATGLCGLRDINPDQETVRMEEMIRSGIRPRIFGIQFHSILVDDGVWAIILKIPKSWNPPHQVTFNSDMRFSARGSAGKYLMDVEELRATIDVSDAIGEKARNFRLERIAKLIAGETPSEAKEGGFIVFHFLPLASFTGNVKLAFAKKNERWPLDPPPFNGGGGFSDRYCFDGYIFTTGYPKVDHYRLFFRSGAMEYVNFYQKRDESKGPYTSTISSSFLEQDVRISLEHALKVTKQLDLDMPAFASISLIGMKGWRLSNGDPFMERVIPFDRDPLLVSEYMIDGLDSDTDAIHKALVDPIWQAAGWEGSPNFTNEKWTPRRQ
jgi:hypothetical protein